MVAAAVADRTSMLYEGTTIAAGRGAAVVVATGAATEVGRSLARPPAAAAGERGRGAAGHAHRGHAARSRRAGDGGGPGGAAAGRTAGRDGGDRREPGRRGGAGGAAVPGHRGAAGRRAPAGRARRAGPQPATIEALGRVDVLCFDKTGTLTEGQLRLAGVGDDGGSPTSLTGLTPLRRVIVAAALRASPRAASSRRSCRSPTDRAVVGAPSGHGRAERRRARWRRSSELPFEPARGYHAILGRTATGSCSASRAPRDRAGPLRRVGDAGTAVTSRLATRREQLERRSTGWRRRGHRVLAVAERRASAGRT